MAPYLKLKTHPISCGKNYFFRFSLVFESRVSNKPSFFDVEVCQSNVPLLQFCCRLREDQERRMLTPSQLFINAHPRSFMTVLCKNILFST